MFIRFRHTDDERRYQELRTQMYRAVAHLPPQLATIALRNLGKLEAMIMLEGVRQGLGIAAIDAAAIEPTGVRDLKAYQAHALTYGSADSPLSTVEAEWAEKLGVDLKDPWLDQKPMRFAPTTLAEREAEQGPPVVVEEDGIRYMPQLPDNIRRMMEAPARDDGEPAFLDKVRDTLLAAQHDGTAAAVKSWNDLIMALHIAMQVDAAFLDLQLSTEQGRAVLDQCGFFDVRAPAEICLADLTPQPPADASASEAG